jgi:hypothetical protein
MHWLIHTDIDTWVDGKQQELQHNNSEIVEGFTQIEAVKEMLSQTVLPRTRGLTVSV